MSDADRPDGSADPHEAGLERALAGALPPDASGTGCPPAELLAALAEGRLPEAARPPIERHLVTCALCRAIAVGLGHVGAPAAGSTASEAAPTAAPRSRRWVWLLLLGVALLALGWWWWSSRAKGGQPSAAPAPAAPRDFDEEFAEAARLVAQAHPDLLGDFVPLDGKGLSATNDVNRGGIVVNAPREVVLSTRPRFRWKQSGQAKVYTLTLRGEDGREVFSERVEGAGADFPAAARDLAPGTSWVWSVKARRATGPVEGSLSFRVATAEEARRFEAQVKAVRATATPRTADLLVAHVALRAGLLEEAERVLRPRAAGSPRPALEQQTLAYVQVRLDTFPEGR